jgi:hypothetical protein
MTRSIAGGDELSVPRLGECQFAVDPRGDILILHRLWIENKPAKSAELFDSAESQFYRIWQLNCVKPILGMPVLLSVFVNDAQIPMRLWLGVGDNAVDLK